jgi:hypothetical protein
LWLIVTSFIVTLSSLLLLSQFCQQPLALRHHRHHLLVLSDLPLIAVVVNPAATLIVMLSHCLPVIDPDSHCHCADVINPNTFL